MVMQGPWLSYFCCPPAGPGLTVTHVQDLANHQVTFDPATGVLNVPPPLAGRRTGTNLGIFVAGDVVAVPIGGMSAVQYDGGLAVGAAMCPVGQPDRVVIPKTGLYRLWAQVACIGLAPGGVCRLTLRVTGPSGFTVPSTFPIFVQGDTLPTSLHSGVDISIPYSPRTAGDVLTAEVLSEAPSGVVVHSVSLMAEWIDWQ